MYALRKKAADAGRGTAYDPAMRLGIFFPVYHWIHWVGPNLVVALNGVFHNALPPYQCWMS